jgi:hypothetical protein
VDLLLLDRDVERFPAVELRLVLLPLDRVLRFAPLELDLELLLRDLVLPLDLELPLPLLLLEDELRDRALVLPPLLFLPPLRLADLPAFAIFAARVLDIPLRLSALYLGLFLTEFPAMHWLLLECSVLKLETRFALGSVAPGELSGG